MNRTLMTLALSVALPVVLSAQGSRLSLWSVAQLEPVGLEGQTRSPAMYGLQLLLLYQPTESKWKYGVNLSVLGTSTKSGPERFSSSAAGVTLEARRVLAPGSVRPYLVGTGAVANLRVDEPYEIGDVVLYGGSDATTAILGAGAGIEVSIGRVQLFSDLQVHWRSNAIYGRSAVPLRLGLRWGRGEAP